VEFHCGKWSKRKNLTNVNTHSDGYMVAYNMAAAHVTTTPKKNDVRCSLFIYFTVRLYCMIATQHSSNSEEIGMDHFSYLPFFFSGFRRVCVVRLQKITRIEIKKRSVCNHSLLIVCVCVCSSNGKCAVVPMLVHSWRGNTARTDKSGTFLFSLDIRFWFSSPTMMLQSKNGKRLFLFIK
jgi:hypothetical protein